MSRPASAWAIQAPDWASPPRFLHDGCIRRTRAEAIDAFCDPMGVTRSKGWKHLYGRGWRAVRVTVALGSPLPPYLAVLSAVHDLRRENQALMQRAIDNYEAAEEGSAAKAYAGGQVRAHQQVDAFLLRRT